MKFKEYAPIFSFSRRCGNLQKQGFLSRVFKFLKFETAKQGENHYFLSPSLTPFQDAKAATNLKVMITIETFNPGQFYRRAIESSGPSSCQVLNGLGGMSQEAREDNLNFDRQNAYRSQLFCFRLIFISSVSFPS